MSINTCLSHHLSWRQQNLLEIQLQKMRSSMYRLTKIFNIYFSLMYTGKPISSKHYKFGLATPLQFRASNKRQISFFSLTEYEFTIYLDHWLLSVRRRHQYWVQIKELIQLFNNWLRNIDFLGYHCILVPGNFFHRIPRLLVV